MIGNKLKLLFGATLLFTCGASAEEQTSYSVEFGNRSHRNCSFIGSPVDFCDPSFQREFDIALATREPDFNHDMIVVAIDTRPQYEQKALAAISVSSKKVYPLPFDHFSSSFSKTDAVGPGRITYALADDRVCIDGAIMAYRSVQSGHMCWRFSGDKFTGEQTPYTYADEWLKNE